MTFMQKKMKSIVFAPDPEIPTQILSEPLMTLIEKLGARVKVLQLVGITTEDHALIRKVTGRGFLKELATTNPLLITDMDR